MPQVSIVILNFNTFNLTCQCIESIYTHTKKVDFEVVLLDNGSTDVDPQQFKLRFKAIQLIVSTVNLGFSKGNNMALKNCRSEVILLLNSDTYLTEDTISICYNRLLLLSNTGALTCMLKSPDGRLQHNCQSFPNPLKLLVEKFRLHKLMPAAIRANYLQGSYWNYNKDGFPDWIWGTFFMLRKEVLNLLPNKQLNEDFFMYLEDMQWCSDLKKIGYKTAYVSQTSLVHLMGGSSEKAHQQIKENIMRYLEQNNTYLGIKLIKLLSN